ncbi:hypothetical protein MTF65_05385 [Streptomyces sp. APSN-46.1]|uniref:hypothetical protein n=1 Tax=Streptomyces sp. APSN-46.1 TaxID=2929049 RepID=UPI001FB4ECE7|nr:hypothetical protein [Streptomyces sp. APSN-46.1]MCJ1676789.1 hypothetical protein [Streptomyces sp. APSN-46.1]
MTSALVLGIDPEAVPTLDAGAFRASLDQELARFGEHGIDAAMALIVFDGSAESVITAALTERPWDVVVVGGGIRKTPELLPLFEQIVNLVRRHAPDAAIAFNATLDDIVESARRRLV